MIQKNGKRNPMHPILTEKIPPLLLYERGGKNYRSQTTSCNIPKRCSQTITKTTVKSTTNTSIQGENHIKAWTRSINGRLAIQTKSQQKQRYRSTRHTVKY